MSRALVLFAFALTALPTAAFGRQAEQPPRVELGGSVGLFVAATRDGVFLLSAGPRVSIRMARRLAVELTGDIVGPVESSGLFGL